MDIEVEHFKIIKNNYSNIIPNIDMILNHFGGVYTLHCMITSNNMFTIETQKYTFSVDKSFRLINCYDNTIKELLDKCLIDFFKLNK
jgi:hypothetical protein